MPIWRSSSAFVERIRPGSPAKRRSSASAAEWNVDARTPSTPSAASRARSSPAALSVNVTATTSAGANAPLATCQAIRRVIVVVLPVPAPARMQTGPCVASTAARCSSFSPAKICSASTDRPPYPGGRPTSSREGAESRHGRGARPEAPSAAPRRPRRGRRDPRSRPRRGDPLPLAPHVRAAQRRRLGRLRARPGPRRRHRAGDRLGRQARLHPRLPRGTAVRHGVHAAQHRPLRGRGDRARTRGAALPSSRRRSSSRRARRRRMPTRATCSRSARLRLDRGDTAVVVVRWRLDCAASKAEVFAASVPLRYTYLTMFTRTERIALPFAVTLRCSE